MSKFIHKINLGSSVWGVPDGVSVLAISSWLSGGERLVYVARDDARMFAMHDSIARLVPEIVPRVFPAWDCLPYDRLSPQGALVGQRVETLSWLAEGGGACGDDPALLLTTVNAILQRVPPAGYFSARSRILAPGDTTGPARLCDFLAGQGYLRTDTVRETGEFALRGGILHIYPPGQETDESEAWPWIRYLQPTWLVPQRQATSALSSGSISGATFLPSRAEALQSLSQAANLRTRLMRNSKFSSGLALILDLKELLVASYRELAMS